MTSRTMDIVGNSVGLIVLVWKVFYDLVWNPRRFKKEFLLLDALEAAKRKRYRTDFTTALAFVGLAIAQVLLLLRVLLYG